VLNSDSPLKSHRPTATNLEVAAGRNPRSGADVSGSERDTVKWWQWPTVLSLDAPVVAAVWQWYLGLIAGVPVGWAETAVLGTSVWLAYAADRWFEGWRVAPEAVCTPRHRFYQLHRWSVAGVWVAVLLSDITLSCTRLTTRELAAGAILLVPAMLYVFSHQVLHRHRRLRLPKEICIALLIAGGTSVFVFATPAAHHERIIIPLSLFVLLSFANVLLIGVWEHEVDKIQGQVSLARQFSIASRFARIVPWIIVVTTVACRLKTDLPISTTGCVAGSALLLVWVDRLERKISWQPARILADAALLTPLVPVVNAWIR
jgi:hypothetical protein